MARLRFGALVRVSTTGQEDRGESLRTQRGQIESFVRRVNGTVVKWYTGQEHSWNTSDRPILNQLLADARDGQFDAVICCDISRIGRDVLVSLQAVKELKALRIQLYDLNGLVDLDSAVGSLMLNVQAVVGEFLAAQTREKSLLNKKALAARGWQVGGKVPYGRYIKPCADKSGSPEWGIIPEKAALVRRMWEMYVIDGLGLDRIAVIVGMPRSKVHHRLHAAGSVWKQTVDGEVFTTRVPALLSDEQMAMLKQRAADNKKYSTRLHTYPLGGHTKCGVCGSTLTCQTVGGPGNKPIRRYVHRRQDRASEACVKMVKAHRLEITVFSHIGTMLSSVEKLEAAIMTALNRAPGEIERLEQRVGELRQRITELKAKESRLVDAIADGTLLAKEARPKIVAIREDVDGVQQQLGDAEKELAELKIDVPDDLLGRVRRLAFAMRRHLPAAWSPEQQQALAEFFFGIRGSNRKLGVFINQHREYEIHGMLGWAEGTVSDDPIIGSQVSESVTGEDVNVADLLGLLTRVEGMVPVSNRSTRRYGSVE